MKPWTIDEQRRLQELYPDYTSKKLAEIFGRSEKAISQKCNELGLNKKGFAWRKKKLSESDLLWLKLNFPHMSNQICSYKLKCGWRTVVRIARSMGLEKSPEFIKECQAHTARKAKESHLRKGTYPPKGWYSPNLQKGIEYQFKKRKHD